VCYEKASFVRLCPRVRLRVVACSKATRLRCSTHCPAVFPHNNTFLLAGQSPRCVSVVCFLVTTPQTHNQLGTPGGAKYFLRGPKFFKLCPTHFSRGRNFWRGAKLLLLTGLLLLVRNSKNHFRCSMQTLQQMWRSWLRTCKSDREAITLIVHCISWRKNGRAQLQLQLNYTRTQMKHTLHTKRHFQINTHSSKPQWFIQKSCLKAKCNCHVHSIGYRVWAK